MPANSHGGSTGEEIGTGQGGSYLWVTKRFPLCRLTQKLQGMAFAPEVFFGFFEGEQQGGAVEGEEVTMPRDRRAAKACAASVLSGGLAGRCRVGNFGDFRTVPNGNDPYDLSLSPIEKTVRPNDDLSMG